MFVETVTRYMQQNITILLHQGFLVSMLMYWSYHVICMVWGLGYCLLIPLLHKELLLLAEGNEIVGINNYIRLLQKVLGYFRPQGYGY